MQEHRGGGGASDVRGLKRLAGGLNEGRHSFAKALS